MILSGSQVSDRTVSKTGNPRQVLNKGGETIKKGKELERLNKDFVKYCDQIGIIKRPRLIKTRKEMHAIQVNAGERKGCAGWGECFWHLDTIFIDTGIRIHYPSKQYKGFRRPDRELGKHKSKYIDFETH